jgi:glycine/D-amino acid oxidase-like deaminating enzyme/nitrite reductase/ring-hydroxylating ferredoxin subunit
VSWGTTRVGWPLVGGGTAVAMIDGSGTTATESVWLDRPGIGPSSAPAAAPEVASGWDAVVIGGGLAGVLTAFRLTQRGARVALFEARTVASRTTGHSTAKVTALHGAIYHTLVAGKGVETATRYAHANSRAVDEIAQLIEDEGIECEAVAATALTCAEYDVGTIERELEAATACGLPVTWTVPTELPFPVAGAVALADQLRIDPVALCEGLIVRLRAMGTSVYEGIRVVDVQEDDTGCTVVGPDFSIRSEVAVLATHLPVVDPGLLAGRATPKRSYVVAGVPAADAPAGMYLATDEGWSVRPAGRALATRSRRVTAPAPRVLIGGEGHPMLDGVDSAPRLERLEQWAVERFGLDVTHRWSAFDYESVDGLPFVGKLAPGARRRFVATGFGKWGMSMSMVSADVIADLIDGREHPAAGILDAGRLLPTVSRKAVTHNVKVAKRFVGDRAAAALTSTPGLEPGTGVVVRRGTSFVGQACDRAGRLHTIDATCPHLGCIVQFNSGEQTWDCPCHGSRFAIDGEVLDGPTRDPLTRLDGSTSETSASPGGSVA